MLVEVLLPRRSEGRLLDVAELLQECGPGVVRLAEQALDGGQ
ncbi:hypothetical protein [Streptomyces sp. NPDC059918]